MTVDTRTGVITEPLTEQAARALTERIRSRAESIAESVDRLVSLIDVARTGQADAALGYPSWTAYVEGEFADALPRLDRSQRQDVVQRLSAKGMSTRAIAPVVSASPRQVARDIGAPVPFGTGAPKSSPIGPEWDRAVEMASGLPDEKTSDPEPPAVTEITGRDGKTYQRPTPRQPDPIAEAKAEAKTQPSVVAAKAIERLVIVTKTIEAAGGADAILADLHGDIADDQAPLWLDFIDQAYAALDPLRAGLRRRNLRSVK